MGCRSDAQEPEADGCGGERPGRGTGGSWGGGGAWGQGDCEAECDDHGCGSLADGNRRVLGFGISAGPGPGPDEL